VKLVLDTNVVIDWLVFDDPFLSSFRSSVVDRRVTVVTHSPAVVELQRVLGYRTLKLSVERQADVFVRYEALTTRLELSCEPLPERFPQCRDSDDDHFLALAWHAKADAVISHDKAVLKLARKAKRFGFRVLTVPQLAAHFAP
jgi:putative PIN family toxin of toxin-antitoxin system